MYRFEQKLDKERWLKDTSTIPTRWLSEELQRAIFSIPAIDNKYMPSVVYVTDAAADYSFIIVVIGNELYVHTDNYDLEQAMVHYTAITGKHPFE